MNPKCCRLLIGTGLFSITLFVLSSFSWAQSVTMSGRTMPPKVDSPLKFTGAGSCNQAKCHGHKSKPRANEYTTWIKAEVHSAGYSVLYEEDSQKIAKDFGLKEKPEKSKECTVCHTLSIEDKPDLKGEKYDINEGVTCELCHGPSEQYLEPHAKPYEPKGVAGDELTAKRAERHIESVKQGMWDVKNFKIRIENCVFCHYQINGNMVKAGHPSLKFEMGYFQKTMPVHWEETPDKGDGFPAKTMVASQAISLRESLANLAKSAKNKLGKELLEISLGQVKSHENVLRALSTIGLADIKTMEAGLADLPKSIGDTGGLASKATKLAGQADSLFNKVLQAKYSAGQGSKIIKAIAGNSHFATSASKEDAIQAFMVVDGLSIGAGEPMLAAIDELYFSLFAEEEGQEPPAYDAKAFGKNLAEVVKHVN
jgi:hypothetical protein